MTVHAGDGPYEAGVSAAGRGDYVSAVRLWEIAAAEQHPKAHFNLGVAYETGKGVPQNFEEAANWYRRAADQDHAGAHFNLSVMYEADRVADDHLAKAWRLRKAAELGHLDAQAKIGDRHLVAEDHAEGMEWLQRAAWHGHAGAQCTLGYVYDKGIEPVADRAGKVWPGRSGVPINYIEAISWYQKSAAQGNTDAQLYLGSLYEIGRSTPRFIDAILGRAKGIPQNYEEAAKWYRMAAQLGRAAAQLGLGLLTANGHGVAQDNIQAHMWFSLAIGRFEAWDQHRKSEAVKNRDIVAAKMTPAQIADAQKLAREWKPTSER